MAATCMTASLLANMTSTTSARHSLRFHANFLRRRAHKAGVSVTDVSQLPNPSLPFDTPAAACTNTYTQRCFLAGMAAHSCTGSTCNHAVALLGLRQSENHKGI